MVEKLQALFQKFDLMHCVVACSELDIYGSSITFYFYCHPLKLQWIYEAIYFGHVMFKVCQYATNDDKVVVGLVSVNNA